ncbi:MAG: histidine kinase [Burkholderiaceae bacterium]|jgi:hypothetical protein|nr:histidine kinase [Burkholderiaceae bacterium]
MNTAATPVTAAPATRADAQGGERSGTLRWALDAVRSISRAELAVFALLALAVAAMNAAWGMEWLQKSGDLQMLIGGTLMPLLIGPFIIVGWLLADRAEGRSRLARSLRLAGTVLLSVTLAVIVAPMLLAAAGVAIQPTLKIDDRILPLPHWVRAVSLWIEVSIYTGLTFAVLEFRRRREAGRRVLDDARREQATLSHRLLQSRLAAMQAQVEPQFLFDSLVDVQATYDRDVRAGADTMDRLITYLRVALPRLREQGSTVRAEVELLAAYLGVVAARHHGRPAVHFAVAPEAEGARFYPMLLLPLVQRAIRLAQAQREVPARVELIAKRHGADLVLLLRIEARGQCADDPDLARVRERLAGLYAERAALTCSEPQPDVSAFVLQVPQ